ncbi:putative reverse transcriptase domain-containing protein, partial [Tanacetum coccineum]
MRQRRWIELFSDYDCEIRYHPGKVNVVADAFSRKERVKPRRVRAMSMTIRSSVTNKILAAQGEASKVRNATAEMLRGLDQQMERRKMVVYILLTEDGIPLIGDVRTIIMDETHASRYLVHPGADKTYYDLGDMHWWPCMKKDIATYHEIPEWKWDRNTMDFITKLPSYTKRLQDEKLARIYIDEIVARHGVPVSIISDCDGRSTSRFLRRTLQKALGSRQLEIVKRANRTIGVNCELKVSPWKGVVHFGKKGKLAS